MKITMRDINVLRNSTWSVWAENIALLLIISLAFYILQPIDKQSASKDFLVISKNSTTESIIAQLDKNGYSVGTIDKLILDNFGKIPSGKVKLKQQPTNRVDFLYALTKSKIALLHITLIPGETKEIFLESIAKKLEINATKLLASYDALAAYPEAAISADTYLVPKKMNEKKLIKFLLSSSERAYKKLALQEFETYDKKKWHRILTIASIIQKEAASNKEMPLIASVIYNRLAKNMRLQMDGTLNYGKYSHLKVTPQRIKSDTSSFNTYKHRGLPNSPIGAVGKHAIRAAIHPAKTNYLFFMRNKKGVHDFTHSFKKHRSNIRKAK